MLLLLGADEREEGKSRGQYTTIREAKSWRRGDEQLVLKGEKEEVEGCQ